MTMQLRDATQMAAVLSGWNSGRVLEYGGEDYEPWEARQAPNAALIDALCALISLSHRKDKELNFAE